VPSCWNSQRTRRRPCSEYSLIHRYRSFLGTEKIYMTAGLPWEPTDQPKLYLSGSISHLVPPIWPHTYRVGLPLDIVASKEPRVLTTLHTTHMRRVETSNELSLGAPLTFATWLTV